MKENIDGQEQYFFVINYIWERKIWYVDRVWVHLAIMYEILLEVSNDKQICTSRNFEIVFYW
jgi:hypothetical protein